MTSTVGVRELKNSLSRYLRLARAGSSIVVLDRGQPVALLSPVPDAGEADTMAAHLAGLAARGLLRLPTTARHRAGRRPPRVDLAAAVAEDREDRA
jgi:antitoxin (DNA-binding transcriptional repressor) of toxin-antitoxin stability system